MKNLFLKYRGVSFIEEIEDSVLQCLFFGKLACPIDNHFKLMIFCDSEENCFTVLEYSSAIARYFPSIEELIFYVEGKFRCHIPTHDIR